MSASYSGPGEAPGNLSGWLKWLGLARRPDTGASAAEPPETSLRQHQLEQIGRFLEEHALDVSAATLSVVCNYLNRSDSALVQAIDRRIQSHRPVTREWLDQVIERRDHTDEAERLRELMQRLDTSLEEFAKSSREAHGAASTYHSELAGQVSELEQVAKAGAVISEMARIGKVMLTRTREIERQMIRSEAQTRTLKRRLEEARRSSEQDHLTGLPNRRGFEAVFESEFHAAGAAGEQLCVVFCDIDHFKRVNDEHGHDAGDRVLRLVAESLAEVSDDRCHVARHGAKNSLSCCADTRLNKRCNALTGCAANFPNGIWSTAPPTARSGKSPSPPGLLMYSRMAIRAALCRRPMRRCTGPKPKAATGSSWLDRRIPSWPARPDRNRLGYSTKKGAAAAAPSFDW